MCVVGGGVGLGGYGWTRGFGVGGHHAANAGSHVRAAALGTARRTPAHLDGQGGKQAAGHAHGLPGLGDGFQDDERQQAARHVEAGGGSRLGACASRGLGRLGEGRAAQAAVGGSMRARMRAGAGACAPGNDASWAQREAHDDDAEEQAEAGAQQAAAQRELLVPGRQRAEGRPGALGRGGGRAACAQAQGGSRQRAAHAAAGRARWAQAPRRCLTRGQPGHLPAPWPRHLVFGDQGSLLCSSGTACPLGMVSSAHGVRRPLTLAPAAASLLSRPLPLAPAPSGGASASACGCRHFNRPAQPVWPAMAACRGPDRAPARGGCCRRPTGPRGQAKGLLNW